MKGKPGEPALEKEQRNQGKNYFNYLEEMNPSLFLVLHYSD